MVNSPFLILLVGAKCERCLFNGFGVRVFDIWIRSEPEYESIEGFSFGLTPKPSKDSDSRPNLKDSVKSMREVCLLGESVRNLKDKRGLKISSAKITETELLFCTGYYDNVSIKEYRYLHIILKS